MFHPSGHSPGGTRIEMSGHILSAGERGGVGDLGSGCRQLNLEPQAPSSRLISASLLLLSSFVSLLITSSSALSIPRAIAYRHLILLCFQRLPRSRLSVPPWISEGVEKAAPTFQGRRACFSSDETVNPPFPPLPVPSLSHPLLQPKHLLHSFSTSRTIILTLPANHTHFHRLDCD